MAKREAFLLRIDPRILQGIREWSDDEMRSINGQIEYLLRQSLQKAGRLASKNASKEADSNSHGESNSEPNS